MSLRVGILWVDLINRGYSVEGEEYGFLGYVYFLGLRSREIS